MKIPISKMIPIAIQIMHAVFKQAVQLEDKTEIDIPAIKLFQHYDHALFFEGKLILKDLHPNTPHA